MLRCQDSAFLIRLRLLRLRPSKSSSELTFVPFRCALKNGFMQDRATPRMNLVNLAALACKSVRLVRDLVT